VKETFLSFKFLIQEAKLKIYVVIKTFCLFFKGITMDEPMEVDESGCFSNHQLVTVGSDGHHIVIGGSDVHPVNVKPEIIRHQPEHPVRKIQPQIKLASKEGNTIRIAPSNIQGR
jgi:hypothetical protein